jgi:DNA-binding NarL/FixJ family response regulator
LGSFPLSSGRGEGDACKEALTQRERTVFALICEGRRNKEVGAQLKIAEATVKIHVKNIMKKLGVNNRTMLIALASGRIGYARSSDHNNLTLGM